MVTPRDEYFPTRLKDTVWFRELFVGPVQSVKMGPSGIAEIRKFSRQDLDLMNTGSWDYGTAQKGVSCYLGSLGGIELYSLKGLTHYHFLVTMKDGTTRFYCERHHVMLLGTSCRYCSWDQSTPVSEFEVPSIPPPPPPGKVGLITAYLEVRPEAQKKFEAFEAEHQKDCCPYSGSLGRWEFMFQYANAAPVAAWVEVRAKCLFCETVVVLQDSDPEYPCRT